MIIFIINTILLFYYLSYYFVFVEHQTTFDAFSHIPAHLALTESSKEGSDGIGGVSS